MIVGGTLDASVQTNRAESDGMTKPRPALPRLEPRLEEPFDSEIDLREYVWVLWRYRLGILSATIACVALALVVGLTSKRTYVTEISLAVSRSKLGAVDERSGEATTANLRPFVEDRGLAAKVIGELGLDKPPYQISASTFFGTVVAVEEVRNSTIISLTGRLDDPALVARTLNRVAELAIDNVRRVSQEEALKARDDIKVQLDESSVRLLDSDAKLRTFRDSSQIELLRRDIDALLGERGGLLKLLVGIETEKARLTTAEQELAGRQRIDTLRRSIDSEPALMESARKPAGQPADVLGLELRNELMNPVYQSLDQQIASSRTTLAALEREKAQLVDVRKLDGKQLAQLSRLYQTEAELSHLELERDLARTVYLEVAKNYELARLLVVGRSSDLHVISPAIEPDRPASRNVVRNTLFALMIGFVLSVVGALFYEGLAGPRREPARLD